MAPVVAVSLFKTSSKCHFGVERFFYKRGIQRFIAKQNPFSISFILFLVNPKKRKDIKQRTLYTEKVLLTVFLSARSSACVSTTLSVAADNIC